MVSKKRCNLSPQAIEAVVCLKDWSLADKRLHDHVREVELMADTENLKISRHEWIKDSFRHQKIMIKIFYWKCIFVFFFLWLKSTND